MSQELQIYILGAGCSVCGGYMVAADVRERLAKFEKEQLSGDNAQELRRCANQTRALLAKYEVPTIDQLSKILRRKDPNAVREAKIALSAMLFSMEDQGVSAAGPFYADFFDQLFHYGSSSRLEARAKASPCRVLTFNYDRLFERTFLNWARKEDPNNWSLIHEADNYIKKLLNMGLIDNTDVSFADVGFTFLKLHGGIGQFNRNRDFGMNHVYWPDLGQELPHIGDEPYFKKKGQESNEPTIFFPDEKEDFEIGSDASSSGSFESYNRAVWRQAKIFAVLLPVSISLDTRYNRSTNSLSRTCSQRQTNVLESFFEIELRNKNH